MKLKLNLEWVYDDLMYDGVVLTGLEALVEREDGSELCKIWLYANDAFPNEAAVKADHMARMAEQLHDLARKQLS